MLFVFGSTALTLLFRAYWLEARSKWMVLAFALGSALTAVYSGLAGVYPITVIEGLWTFVALQRFLKRHRERVVLST